MRCAVCSQAAKAYVCVCVRCPQALKAAAYLHHLMLDECSGPDGGQMPTQRRDADEGVVMSELLSSLAVAVGHEVGQRRSYRQPAKI